MIECLVKLICGRYIRFDCSNRSKVKSLKTYYEKFKPDPRAYTLMEDYKKRRLVSNVIKLRNDGFEENTKNVLLFFLWKI